MKQVIYIDILAAVSIFVNYFILNATSRFLCLKPKTLRLIIGEILGVIYSLYIFFPEPIPLISFLIKLLMACTITWAVFGIKSFKLFIKALACFYSMSFAFSGLMFFIWCIWKPGGMTINNGVVYFNISPIVLIVSTFIAYIAIEMSGRIIGKRENKNKWCKVNVVFSGKSTAFQAKIDTCNCLREPFSNLPVIVTRQNTINPLIPENSALDLRLKGDFKKNIVCDDKLKIRIIPFRTVSGEGLLPAFRPDFIFSSDGVKKQAYIAVCSDKILPKETPALMNPELLN